MGVTTLSESKHDAIPPEVGHSIGRRLLLVFERATEGSLLEYLDRVLPGLSFMQAWDKITGIVSNVANGLNSLHKQNVIHR
jgi:serine/threonine protein kinase